jgi:hypothetical protein
MSTCYPSRQYSLRPRTSLKLGPVGFVFGHPSRLSSSPLAGRSVSRSRTVTHAYITELHHIRCGYAMWA